MSEAGPTANFLVFTRPARLLHVAVTFRPHPKASRFYTDMRMPASRLLAATGSAGTASGNEGLKREAAVSDIADVGECCMCGICWET